MISILEDIFNMTYSLGHQVNEIILGYELYKVVSLEMYDKCRYEIANPKVPQELLFNNIKITCDATNPIIINIK